MSATCELFHDQRPIGTAKTKGVGQGSPDCGLPRGVRHEVEVGFRIRMVEVESCRQNLVGNREGKKSSF